MYDQFGSLLHCSMNAERRRKCHSQLFGVLLFMVAISVMLMTVFYPANVYATSSVQQVQQDQKTFREFFQFRFPDLVLEEYSKGASALPQFARQRSGHQLLMSSPPYNSALREAGLLWKQPLATGVTLAECFSGKPPPTAYPFLFEDAVHSLEGDINDCLSGNGSPPLATDSGLLAAAVAALKDPFRGQPIDVDIRDERVRSLYDTGKKYFWTKRGQMNLSCANCHVHNAGNQLRGDVLSSALGHGAGYPAFSIRQFSKPLSAQSDDLQSASGSMQTLHQRYQQCNIIAGATPLPLQNQVYLALEIYQAIMNEGLPIDAPGVRQ